MAKGILKSDLDNIELNKLPIRRGCIGPCACSGYCKEVLAYIDRKEYEDFIEKYISLEEFLTKKII